ncbi:hypothetical protein VSS37_08170 [Candidatus Thiothrix sp. Deng01]|uniref:Uncharacterized protein n=1 Tax=Candidatus Thiothrix phosphatis TaxID=3112415 RepID=A0ABU6CX17_9GAMM|nr:hypothetical protein [Candidatus Thiothrix sp. Deng01]MEB4590948.1 hypothetical protein [Candidatus Thiothrix sp. Deng01]
MQYLFNSLGEVISAFKEPELQDQSLKPIVQLINSRLGRKESLGFFKKGKLKAEEEILRILTEQGRKVSKKQLEQLTEYLEKQRKNEDIKRRSFIQVFFTAIILMICVWQLDSQPGSDTQKAVFTVIGAIIGYWLR